MPERLDEDGLKALLSDEIAASIAYDDTELSRKRALAMEYYRGEMRDTPFAPGRSSVTSRDVADTIGWMLPGIIRVFTASDTFAEFEPERPGDEEAAKQATDYLNYVFYKDNPGYRNLWDATHDSLLQANGVVKHWWDDAEETEYSEHSGLTAEDVAMLLQDGNAEVVAQAPGEPQMELVPDETGMMVEVPVETFKVKIKRTTRSGRVRVKCIKPEDFLLDRDATCIEDARFAAHRDLKSRSDLIEMGFDRDVVDGLPTDTETNWTEEKLARDDDYLSYNDTGDESTRLIEVFECYIKADVDGDGVAEMVRAYFAGGRGSGEMLDWEVWEDDLPFTDIPCEPVPHRWEARSIFDETVDIQRIKTVLTRQMLDNLYASNVPMREAEQGSVINPEMLLAPKFGGVIWRKAGSQPIVPHSVPFVADKVLVGLEHFDQVAEKRTGVSRSTMALDPQALTNQTATASQNQRDAAYSQIELIARNMAELGWRRVFRQLLRIVVKHQDRPRVIRLRDEWVTMDPRHWNADMDATINVGLGTGSRDRDMAMLNVISQSQVGLTERMAQSGMAGDAIDMLPKIVRTFIKIGEAAGIKNPESYYPEFSEEKLLETKQQMQERASQPDPKTQADLQKTQAQMQLEQQKAASNIELERFKAEQNAVLEREKMANEAALKREQIMAEMALKREQLSAELQLKRELAMAEIAVKRDVGFYSADVKGAATSQVNMGGEPG